MNKTKRHQQILKLINGTGEYALTTKELAEQLDISETTIRRDFQELADAGLILRQHGGAVSPRRPPNIVRGDVGVVLVSRGDRYSDPFFNTVLEGADQRLNELGYRVSYVKTYFHIETARMAGELLETQPVDGMLLLGAHRNAEGMEYLRRNVRCLTAAIDDVDPQLDIVSFDGYNGMRNIVTHLAKMGRKRLGFITGVKDHRYDGFLSTVRDLGLPDDPALHLEIDYGLDGWLPEMGEKGAACLMALDTPPDAIVCASDRVAIGAMRWLHNQGYRIPSDIAVTGFDNIQEADFTFPPLTTVHVHKFHIGRLAAERVVRRIENPDEIPLRITTPTSLVVRKSCGTP
ncbi:MAG: hypothetical protein CL607_00850 [Anaerolineaceae bacterium]|nr:hypothetical protein [Anaerolineaceae bacterium]